MISNLPAYVYFTFFIAVVFALIMFYYASNRSYKFVIGLILWGTLHSILALVGFYKTTSSFPPRSILIVFPMFPIMMSSIFSYRMKNWLSTFHLKTVTYLHLVRVPTEMVLYWLYIDSYAPRLITFRGQNFDILIGLTIPIITYFAFRNNKVNKRFLLIWNIVALAFLLNILVMAVFSMPTVVQLFALNHPNYAPMMFPIVLLPTVIIPTVLISHMAGIALLRKNNYK